MIEWGLIAGMMALTFGPRYLPFNLAGKIHLPPLVTRALNYVPIAVLTAIIAQASLIRNGNLELNVDNHHLLAATIAMLVALTTKHLFMTIAVGLAAFGLAEWLL